MVGAVVLAAVFFCTISVLQFNALQARLDPRPSDFTALMAQFDTLPAGSLQERSEILRTKALITLEQQALARRYDQAAAIVSSKLWTRFMGFVTGMLLALIGAAFVLGKLREQTSTVAAAGHGLQLSLTSASPGLVLSTLGVALMGLAIASSFEIQTTDVPIYYPEGSVRTMRVNSTDRVIDEAQPVPETPPPPLEEKSR
jgi:hypothetical protein